MSSTAVDPEADTEEGTYRFGAAGGSPPADAGEALARWRLARFDAQTGAALATPRWEVVWPSDG